VFVHEQQDGRRGAWFHELLLGDVVPALYGMVVLPGGVEVIKVVKELFGHDAARKSNPRGDEVSFVSDRQLFDFGQRGTNVVVGFDVKVISHVRKRRMVQ
jgi:hypothetical protein